MSVVSSNFLVDVFVADVAIGDEAHSDIGIRIGIDDRGSRIDQIFSFCPLDQAAHRAGSIKNEGRLRRWALRRRPNIPAEKGCGERAKTKVRIPMRGIVVLLQCFVPSEPRFHRLHGPVRSKTRRLRYEFAAELAPTVSCSAGRKSARLGQWKSPARQISLVPAPDRRQFGDGARDRAAAPRGCYGRWGFSCISELPLPSGRAGRSGGA